MGRRYGCLLEARAVHDGDSFQYAYGTQPFCTHIPQSERTPITHVYAIAVYPSGYRQFEVIEPAAYVGDLVDDGDTIGQLCKIAITKLLTRLVPNG